MIEIKTQFRKISKKAVDFLRKEADNGTEQKLNIAASEEVDKVITKAHLEARELTKSLY